LTNSPRNWWHICKTAQAQCTSQFLQKSHQANAQRHSNMDRQQHDRKEARTGNMRLASCGVKCLNSSSVFQLGFSARLTVLFSEIPHERQAQKRYAQAEKKTTTQQIDNENGILNL